MWVQVAFEGNGFLSAPACIRTAREDTCGGGFDIAVCGVQAGDDEVGGGCISCCDKVGEGGCGG